MSKLDAEVIVVGAGLVGAACALRLAHEGREVLLIDAQAPGLGASFGNAGHIATEQVTPLASSAVIRSSWRHLLAAESPLRIRLAYLLPILPWLARFIWAARPSQFSRGVAALMSLQETALDDLQDLAQLAGVGDQLHRDGYLRIWESAQGRQSAHAQAAEAQRYGIRTAAMVADALPAGLSPAVSGAMFYPDTGHVDDPHALCTGFVDAFKRLGGRVEQQRVRGLAQEGQTVSAMLEQGSTRRARQLVLAAGAWSRPLAASLGCFEPLDTERGYHINLPWGEGPPRLPMPIASTERNVIMTPMTQGLRMTGTLEFGGLHLPPDPHRIALLHRQMQSLLPGAQTAQASSWMGFRPSMPDHMPVIGRVPRHPNVVFAFGHQHLGLTLSGVTARLVGDLLAGRQAMVDMASFRVGRFG